MKKPPQFIVQELEEYATHDSKFNRYGRPRIRWQSDLEDTATYILASPLFARNTTDNARKEITYTIHPWIAEAVQRNQKLLPNSERPTILDFDDDELRTVDESTRGELQHGDIMWCSFTVSYVVGRKDWRPEIRLFELIRVGRWADPVSSNAESSNFPAVQRRSLAVGKITASAREF